MKNPFTGIEKQISEIIENNRQEFNPPDDLVQRLRRHIYEKVVPECSEDVRLMGAQYTIRLLERYKAECASGYEESTSLLSDTTGLPDDHCQRRGIGGDLFEYRVFYQLSDLMIKAINLDLNDHSIDAKYLPKEADVGQLKRPKISSKHFVLAYLLDCVVKGITQSRVQAELENIGQSFAREGMTGNTFRRWIRDNDNKYDIHNGDSLEDTFGERWRDIMEIIFKEQTANNKSPISSKWDEIDKYLKSKHL